MSRAMNKSVTPGKWQHDTSGSETFVVLGFDAERIKIVALNIRNEADAKAISATPELLHAATLALQVFKDYLPYEHGSKQIGEAWGALETAIKKATS